MLINKKYLSEYSPLPKNYDVTNLMPYVNVAEKIWLKPIIGHDLYEELEEQIENNELNEENSTLLTEGGLWQYLAFATLHEGLPFIWAKITEAGIQLGKSDNSDSIDIKDLTVFQQHIRNQVEVLKEELIKWLCTHAESFPLFDTCQCDACGCGCGTSSNLKQPNPQRIIYGTPRRCTNIK